MTVQGCYETGVNRRELYQPQISGESRESDCQRIKYLCMGISGHPILHLGTSLHLRTCKNSIWNGFNNNMLQAKPWQALGLQPPHSECGWWAGGPREVGAIAGIKGTQLVPTMPQVSSYPLPGNSVSGFVCFSPEHPNHPLCCCCIKAF